MALGDVGEDTRVRFSNLVAQRIGGVPLQYLEGTVQFGPVELAIDDRALIPRPETERLWELVVQEIGQTQPELVVDLCTGSGNLALAMKHQYPSASVYGTDVSSAAVSIARQNGLLAQLDVEWLHGDLFVPLPSALRHRIDVVVSNPPYIAAEDFDTLPAEVREHEPFDALIAGPRGDEVLARIAREAADWLRPGGLIACEIGAAQGGQAEELFVEFQGRVVGDLAGRDRYVLGHRPVD